MKILFILPDVDSFHKVYIHFGVAYISGFLRANGYDNIKFLTVTSVDDYGYIVNEAASFNPDIIGFTSVESQFCNVISLSKMLKEACKSVIVCGGAFPTLYPECVKMATHLDGIFIGESEGAFLKFVKAVEQGKDYRVIENYCFYDKNDDRIVKNNLLPIEGNLDSLGFPDRDIFNFQMVINSHGAAPFMFNRGCPYNCSFCSNHALAITYGKHSNIIRRRSVDSCIAEIENVASKYNFDVIYIWDDLFILDRKWLYDFLYKYRRQIKKPFMCCTRSNLCDDELFGKLKEGGCYKVHMSLESGNDFIRNKILKRNISSETIIKSFNIAHKYGIQVNASSIIGIPFETENMIKETISLLGALRIENPSVNIFYPYKGTHLRDVCVEYGMIEREINFSFRERRESVLKSPYITKEKLQYYHDNFELLVRREEGIAPFLGVKLKRISKIILPQKIQQVIRKIMRKYFLHKISPLS
jgi:radical SAM superfamily enzyme YgiQ (UPF0313 family)